MIKYKQVPLHKRSFNALGRSKYGDLLHYLKSISKKQKGIMKCQSSGQDRQTCVCYKNISTILLFFGLSFFFLSHGIHLCPNMVYKGFPATFGCSRFSNVNALTSINSCILYLSVVQYSVECLRFLAW